MSHDDPNKPFVRCKLAPGEQEDTRNPALETRSEEDARALAEAPEDQADGDSHTTQFLREQAEQARAASTD
ncbi:MAG TPA: hypothetical protein VFH51_00350 [Myxococcota bacterium]|nr:hypothetical protein [Myxococcota bacterium]